MKSMLAGWMLAGCLGVARAQAPPDPGLFQAGVFGDDDRSVTCVSGEAGDVFTQQLWAWVPDDLGLAYITLRFDFPDNVDLSAHAVFNPAITQVIFTPYPGGTIEWNLVFAGCPSGWIRVFEQRCVLLDNQPGEIRILGDHSLMRDCSRFVLNDVTVLNNLTLNDPGCAAVPVRRGTWAGVKSLYRQSESSTQ